MELLIGRAERAKPMRTRRGTGRIDRVCLGVKVAAIAFLIVESIHGISVAAEASDPYAVRETGRHHADRLRAAGLREFTGKHLTLYTDLPATPCSRKCLRVFDAAVPQWCRFFKVDPARVANWRMHAFLMKEKARRRGRRRLRRRPEFKNGFCAYVRPLVSTSSRPTITVGISCYTRERTASCLRYWSCGTAWFSEGVAELAATHRWDSTAPAIAWLMLGDVPRNREEVPAWGRIATIKADLRPVGFARSPTWWTTRWRLFRCRVVCLVLDALVLPEDLAIAIASWGY